MDTKGTRVVKGNGSEILVESLHEAGVTTLFGLSGDTGVAFYDALYNNQNKIKHVMARDERSAAFMADVYARTTNKVGVVEVSSGGGVDYVVSGLGEAFASSTPILVITSDIHSQSRGTGALTEIDQNLLFSAVTKWQATVPSASMIPRLLAEAFTAATTGRPAPVCLIVPEEVFEQQCEASLPASSASIPRKRPAAVSTHIRQAAEALVQAERPGIVVGSGVHLSEAWPELARLVETAGIPVATTIHGKGAFPESNRWSLGVVGANGARQYTNDYLAEADVVLFIGTRANATDTNGWTSPPRNGLTIIQNDIEYQRAGRNFPDSIPLVGDGKIVIQQLIDALPQVKQTKRHNRLLSWIEQHKKAWHNLVPTPAANNSTGVLDPREVVQAIEQATDPDAPLVVEAGTPTPYVAAYWETQNAGRNVITPRGHGPMGYAVPGAIGASFACPYQSVVALTTDGSFGMCCGELETAARLQLPITYVHFDNGSMSWIKMLQYLYLGKRYFGVDLGSIDTVAVADAMGIEAAHAKNLEEFSEVFERVLASSGPSLIDVSVPEHMNLTPPVAPWHAALAGETERPVY